MFIVYKWPHTPQTKEEVGYTKTKLDLNPLEVFKFKEFANAWEDQHAHIVDFKHLATS